MHSKPARSWTGAIAVTSVLVWGTAGSGLRTVGNQLDRPIAREQIQRFGVK